MKYTTETEDEDQPSIFELVEDVVDEWTSDLSFYAKTEIPNPTRDRLTKILGKRLQSRLADVRDDYVEMLEEKVHELQGEVEAFESKGYESVKNDLRYTENVLKKILYIYNDGEPLSLRKSQINEMDDVILDFADKGDQIEIITEELE